MKTKKTLTWRFRDLPSPEEVIDLIANQIITKEEARELLFKETEEDTDKDKAQKEEIKFLRELVDTLAAKSGGWTTIVKEYRDYTPRYPAWYNGYSTTIGGLSANSYHVDSASGTGNTFAINNSVATGATSGTLTTSHGKSKQTPRVLSAIK